MRVSGIEELYAIVRKIPRGRCSSYSELGAALTRPVSGVIVGGWMSRAPDGVPWWRVVGRNGELKTVKVHPGLSNEQRDRLEAEGVTFEGDLVEMSKFGWSP